jgi:hypothetical protein
VTCLLKAGILEPKDMTAARKRLCKHTSMAMNMHARKEELL